MGLVAIDFGVGSLEVVDEVGLGDGMGVRVLPDLTVRQLGFELPAGLLGVVVFHLENKYWIIANRKYNLTMQKSSHAIILMAKIHFP